MKNMAYVLLSVGMVILTWGAYGNLLSWGTRAMGNPTDPAIGVSHFLPFIFVGVAYFIIAVVAAWIFLAVRGEPGNWSTGGVTWSFLAGAVTAIGALGVILGLAYGGSAIYMMPLIFGGAPVVNTLLTMWMSKIHREASPLFYAGLILVIAGAAAVLIFSPAAQGVRKIDFLPLLKVIGFVVITAICWGAYGPLLHKGQMQMHGSRMRPFICVGLAYVVVAVALPFVLRAIMGDHGYLTLSGSLWSLAGGATGALGSLGVILAFTYGGKPVYVMPLVFGGAPVINTFISIATAKQLSSISPFFYAGLIVVIAGAVSVLIFAPRGQPHTAATATGTTKTEGVSTPQPAAQ
jgi:hypothetical protein